MPPVHASPQKSQKQKPKDKHFLDSFWKLFNMATYYKLELWYVTYIY